MDGERKGRGAMHAMGNFEGARGGEGRGRRAGNGRADIGRKRDIREILTPLIGPWVAIERGRWCYGYRGGWVVEEGEKRARRGN